MKKSIIVVGASSHIGSVLTRKLLENEYEVFTVNRKDSSHTELLKRQYGNQIYYYEFDLGSDYQEGFPPSDRIYESVIVLAWSGTGKAERNNEKQNRKSAENLFSYLSGLLDRIRCEKVILAGTQAEYGNLEGCVTEEKDCQPSSSYGKCKLLFYHRMQTYCTEKEAVLIELRLHSVFGYTNTRQQMIQGVVKKLLYNEDIVLNSNCLQIWDFIYIDDVVEAFWMASNENLCSGIYNISSNKMYTLREYIEKAKEVLNSQSKVVYSKDLKIENPNFFLDSSKFRYSAKWGMKIGFEQGIRRMAEDIAKGEDRNEV